MRRWIIIANAARAMLFSKNDRDELELIRALVHPRSRERAKEIGTDQPGRTRKGTAASLRSSMEPRTDLHQAQVDRFAGEIAAAIQAGMDQRAFEGLAIFASPRLLGRLRGMLSPQVSRCLETCIAQDCTRISGTDLRDHVAEALPHWFAPRAPTVA